MTLVRQPSSTAPSRQRADIAIPQPMNRASPDAWRLQLRGSWARCQECPALLSHARRQRRSAWAAAALCRLPRRWRGRGRRPGSRPARIGGACVGWLSSWCCVVVDCRLLAGAAGCSARDLNSETRAICSRRISEKFSGVARPAVFDRIADAFLDDPVDMDLALTRPCGPGNFLFTIFESPFTKVFFDP